jgi:hypothetical protein
VPEELGHEDRRPCGKYDLVSIEFLAGHDECDVMPRPAPQELADVLGEIGGWDGELIFLKLRSSSDSK